MSATFERHPSLQACQIPRCAFVHQFVRAVQFTWYAPQNQTRSFPWMAAMLRVAAAAAGLGMGWLVVHWDTIASGGVAGFSVTRMGPPVSPRFWTAWGS
jgi:hypothetical protein